MLQLDHKKVETSPKVHETETLMRIREELERLSKLKLKSLRNFLCLGVTFSLETRYNFTSAVFYWRNEFHESERVSFDVKSVNPTEILEKLSLEYIENKRVPHYSDCKYRFEQVLENVFKSERLTREDFLAQRDILLNSLKEITLELSKYPY